MVKLYQIPVKLMQTKKKSTSKKVSQPNWYTDDVIAFILASLKDRKITTNESKIHGAIFKLKQEYPDFFKDLIFYGNGNYQFSKDLERILFRFYQSNVLSTLNPSFEVYLIEKPKKTSIKSHLKDKFSADEIKKLNAMSKTIESENLLNA